MMAMESTASAATAISQAASQMGVELTPTQLDQLQRYLALVQKWNKVYNLTALRDPADMLTHHLFDSLSAIAPLQRQLAQMGIPLAQARLLDVGSGAGLPGVVMAVCCPTLAVACVDTVGKKAAFVQQVALELRLPNLRGVHARVESLTEQFDVVSSRAFASLVDFTTWSRAALAPHGVWLAMKGKHPADEIAALPTDVAVFHVEQLHVPALDAERCIVWLNRPIP